MTLRIGWVSPLTPASGVGTFSHAIAEAMPASVDGEVVDLTLLYPDHAVIHQGSVRSIRIEDTDSFRNVLELFDLLIYNIGNNTEHHDTIFRLLRTHPGIIVCHDYVYQHYLADRSMHNGRSFASFAALMMKFGDGGAGRYLARSRITSRLGKIRYSPWDSEASAAQPMSEAILDLGSALVVHSRFAEAHVEKRFQGPILRLGMPHDQKPAKSSDNFDEWARTVGAKQTLHMVSFGHIQATKSIDLVIEALAASRSLRRGLRYTIAGHVGDWDYLRRLEDIVAATGLGESVRFETAVSDARLVELMRGADVFINLRRPNTEGSSASLIEQLDSGRPVVVLASGCYAELPSHAAIKLPPEAGIEDIGAALEQLVAKPEQLAAIGASGRAYAHIWSCASYGERFIRFLQEHRALLRRRGAVVGTGERPRDRIEAARDQAWITNLAGARAAMRYLDRNVMMLDPELVMGLGSDELCNYVAQVILGIFDDARLHRALARFFVGRDGRASYWACAKFFLIVEGVFGGDEAARRRLAILGPCYDPEFWDVIEAFPAAAYATTAALTLLGRSPTAEEIAVAEQPGQGDGPAKRQVLLEFLRLTNESDPGVAKLKRWVEQPLAHEMETELPAIESELDCTVGTAQFHENADLSGFYPQQIDHAWTRGTRGFVGLRLGRDVRRVEMLVRNVDADDEQSAVIGLSSGTAVAELEVRDNAPHMLALDIPRHLARSDATTWLQLSTTRAGSPLNNPADTRMLGVCLFKLKTVLGSSDEASALASHAEP